MSLGEKPLPHEAAMKFSKALLSEIETRGKDATGICWMDEPWVPRVRKAPVKASEFNGSTTAWSGLNDARAVILHTRAATSGKPDNNDNNHPLWSGEFIGVHNGIISNHDELKKTLNFSSEVDSQSIWQAIHASKGQTTLERIKDAVAMLSGSMACAMVSRSEPKTLYLFNEGSGNLDMGHSEELGILAFASSYQSIFDASDIAFGRNKMGFNFFTVIRGSYSNPLARRVVAGQPPENIPIKGLVKSFTSYPKFNGRYHDSESDSQAWNEDWWTTGSKGTSLTTEDRTEWYKTFKSIRALFIKSHEAKHAPDADIARRAIKTRFPDFKQDYLTHYSLIPDLYSPKPEHDHNKSWYGVTLTGYVIPIWSPTEGRQLIDALYNKICYVTSVFKATGELHPSFLHPEYILRSKAAIMNAAKQSPKS
jgi:hypothetical protein